MAIDVAQTIKPRNSLEKMLAHEVAAAHRTAMTMIARAGDEFERISNAQSVAHRQAASVEAARLANAAGRMMAAVNEAALTIQKLRTGGKQVVKVIHQQVQVNEGGRAVVAGSIKSKPKRGGSGTPGRGRK